MMQVIGIYYGNIMILWVRAPRWGLGMSAKLNDNSIVKILSQDIFYII